MIGVIAIFAAFTLLGSDAQADQSSLSAKDVMENLVNRNSGEQVSRNLRFELTSSSGKQRVESAESYRIQSDNANKIVLFYTNPSRIRGIGFLTFDYSDPEANDDQWLYLPAFRKIRRISASNRGDYFLGTDFTFEQIKKEQKIQITDYEFNLVAVPESEEAPTYIVEALPRTDAIRDAIGHSKAIFHVSATTWLPIYTEYYNANGNLHKTIELETTEEIEGILTPTEILAEDKITGHQTRLTISEIDYSADVDERLFTQARLRRGL